MLGPHPNAVVFGHAAPGDGAIGLDQEDRRTGDGSATRLSALVDDPPGSDRFAFDIRKQRKLETEAVRETRRLLDGVDRNRDDLGAGGIDF
jgi:hypothetical protein